MAGPLPHSKQFAEWAADYLSDAEQITRASFSALSTSPDFIRIYQNSFAVDAVISRLSTARWRPAPQAMRRLILRHPFVVATRQLSLAKVELRRLIELAVWVAYFSEHPVEWGEFEANPTAGFHPAPDQPIRYCAHRSIKFYLDYAAERLAAEPSGFGRSAVEELRRRASEINPIVHPAHLSTAARKQPPFEQLSPVELREFAEIQRAVYSSISFMLAAVFRSRFDKFPAMHRAQFDWLVGKPAARKVRQGPFGL